MTGQEFRIFGGGGWRGDAGTGDSDWDWPTRHCGLRTATGEWGLAPATHTYTADTLRGWWREWQWGDVRRKERPPSPRAERAAMAAVVRLEADSAMNSAHGHSSA